MWLGKEESRLSAAEGHPPHRPPAGCFSFTPDDMGPTNGYWPITGAGPSSSRVTLLHWVKPLQGEEATRWLKQGPEGDICDPIDQ